jgi:hypothetical protein
MFGHRFHRYHRFSKELFRLVLETMPGEHLSAKASGLPKVQNQRNICVNLCNLCPGKKCPVVNPKLETSAWRIRVSL